MLEWSPYSLCYIMAKLSLTYAGLMFKLQQIKETIPSINVQSFAAKFHKLPVKRRDSEPTGNMNSLQIK